MRDMGQEAGSESIGVGSIDDNADDGGNGDARAGVRVEVNRPAQQTAPSLGQRERNYERRTRIDQLALALFQQAADIAEDDPDKAIKLYKEAEYAVLSAGKGALGKAYIRIAQAIGVVSFESSLKKEQGKLDDIVKNYRKDIRVIEQELEKVSKRANELKAKRDKSFELDDLVNSEIADEEKALVTLNEQYRSLAQGQYNQETIAAMNNLREEARKKKAYISKLKEDQVENAIYHRNINQEQADAESQEATLRDQMDRSKMEMYDKMQQQAPTIYIMRNVRSWKRSYTNSRSASIIGQRINVLVAAARGAGAALEEATYHYPPAQGGDTPPYQPSDMEQKRDAQRKIFAEKRAGIVDDFNQNREFAKQNDSLI